MNKQLKIPQPRRDWCRAQFPLRREPVPGPNRIGLPSSVPQRPLPVASKRAGATFRVMAREFQDDLIAVNSARLRAEGLIKPEASSATVSFGEGPDALLREIGVWHRKFRNGRGISLFLCPGCAKKAQLLKLHDGRPQCRNCLKRRGVQFRIAYGTRAERADARAKRIEKLKAKLTGGPLRRDGRGIARRRELELSLRRALIREREGLLEVDL